MDQPSPRLTPDELEGLFEPGTANRPLPYLKRLLGLRQYVWAEASGNVESRHADTAWGGVWLYLEPLLELFIWFLIFGVGIRTGRDIPGEDEVDFFTYLAVGMTSYGLMRAMFKGAMNALGTTRAIPFDFPRAVSVLSTYAKTVYEYRFQLAIMFLLIMVRGNTPRLSWLLFVPLTLLAVTLAGGIGFFLGRIGVTMPNTSRFADKVIQFAYWMSGVILPVEGYILQANNGETLLTIYTIFNPLYAVVKLHQWAAFGYRPPSVEHALWSAPVWAVVLLVAGFIWMSRGEASYRLDGDRRG